VPNVAWWPLLAAAVVLMTGAISISAWPSHRVAGNPLASGDGQDARDPAKLEKEAKDSEASAPERYGKWLDQEVVYIIDDAERAAFRSLPTNAERDKFIEQFWERRNPHPGSATNTFKEEHYRRIAFANKRFGTASGTPGWQTDRGHVYIVYGPPDQIDSAAPSSPKMEVWTYRHVEGVGDKVSVTFLDTTGRGDYHLAPGPSR
jgi:GWxTD domain-containing protein